MKFTRKSLLDTIKSEIERRVGEKVDFRKHAFLENQYNLVPCFKYDFAKQAVNAVYSELENVLEENPECFKFGGWEWNESIAIESLRQTPLKTFIECRIDEMLVNQVRPKFEILNTFYDEEIGAEVLCALNEKKETFFVQLSGGEFLPQMGCLLIGKNEDNSYFNNYFDEIIKAGEDCYDAYIDSLKEIGEWETVFIDDEVRCSATSYTREVIERKINFDKDQDNYEFRVIRENNGFTQPNSYSSMPDFSIEHFSSLEAAKDYLKTSEDERLYIKNNR